MAAKKKAAKKKVAIKKAAPKAAAKAPKATAKNHPLFDKILIPRAKRNIQRILIFLGDLERSAVSTAKLTKRLQAKRRAKAMAEGAA